MPAPCSTSITTLIRGAAVTDSNYTTPYKDSASPVKTSCLPNSGEGYPSTDTVNLNTSGTIKTETLNTHIDSLFARVSGSKPPTYITADASGVSNYQTKTVELSNMIEDEYCYYYAIYNFILPKYLNLVAVALPNGQTQVSAAETTMKANVISINRKLNQLIQVYIGLVNVKNTTLESYYVGTTNINSVNPTITSTLTSLKTQADILQSASSESEIKSAMIEYSIEKNQSSRNLLAVYGFMNIVAVGLIFYLYRSTKS